MIKKDQILDAYPLSKLQSGIHFHAEMEQQEVLYHDVFSIHLRSPWNKERFVAAIEKLLSLHAVLRTSFEFERFQMPLQLVHRDGVVRFRYLTPEISEPQQLEDYIAQEVQQLEQQDFELAEPTQIRFTIIRRNDAEFQLLVDAHHMILDGWSMATLLTQLFGLYLNLPGVTDLAKTAASSTSFKEFIKLEQQALQDDSSQQFWLQRLSSLSYDPVDFGHRQNHAKVEVKRLSLSDYCHRLNSMAQAQQVSLKELLLSVHLRVCSFILGTEYGMTALVTNGRPEVVGGDQITGLFLNMLPVCVDLQHESWEALIQKVKAEHNSLMRQRRYPFSQMVKQTGNPVSDICFNYVHFHVYEALQGIADFQVVNGDIVEKTNFTLTFTFHQGLSGELDLLLQYNTERVNEADANAVIGYVNQAIQQVCADSSQDYLSQTLLSEPETAQIRQLNQLETQVSVGPLHRLFEQRAQEFPQAIAVCNGERHLSYEQLNTIAAAWALQLQSLGVAHGDRVGIYLDRSESVIISILAVLKLGAAYVPVDPAAPASRVAFILKDAQLVCLMSEQKFSDKLAELNAKKIWVEQLADKLATDQRLEPIAVEGSDLAYVIYTSGSTGQPKGVQVSHDNVGRLFSAAYEHFHFDHNDVWTLFHSYAFDFSVWEIWGAMLHGGRLVIVPYWVTRSTTEFYQLLQQQQVTVLNQTPAAFYQLMEVAAPDADLALRYVVMGGDKLNLSLLKPWFERYGDSQPQIINMYGITETTVHVTYRRITQADVSEDSGVSLIGQPLADLGMLILGPHQTINPCCVTGELYISGAGLARGYLERPELNRQRFIETEIPGQPLQRLYRTGDLARLRRNGDVEYIGRADYQIQFKGFRIELGEIECLLTACEVVRDARLVVSKNDQHRVTLLAYVILKLSDSTVKRQQLAEIKQQLRSSLPDYMMPTQIIPVERFVLTINGKLDLNALPSPQANIYAETYLAPQGELEFALADIWADVLSLDAKTISRNSNFFDLGGDSLTAMQVVSAVRSGLGREVSVKVFFEAGELASFAACLQESSAQPRMPQMVKVADEVEYEEGVL
ncbi:MAG: amino acid adenylation domain-containing protein [Cyanobacteria bacterium P01_F01_bin.116]